MLKILELHELLGQDTTDGNTPAKYGILVDTDQSRICVLMFYNHQDLLNIILSDTYNHLILYRTQYHMPTDAELEEFSRRLLSE